MFMKCFEHEYSNKVEKQLLLKNIKNVIFDLHEDKLNYLNRVNMAMSWTGLDHVQMKIGMLKVILNKKEPENLN